MTVPVIPSLSGLAISPGTLSPSFVSVTTSYTAATPVGTSSMLVTPTVSAGLTYSVTSSAGSCDPGDVPSACPLEIGTNLVTVTVTGSLVLTPKNVRYVKFVALTEVGGRGPWASVAELGVLDAAGSELPKTGWSVTCSSEQQPDEPCAQAIDGDPNTIWHTQYLPEQLAHPHEIVVDLGEVKEVAGTVYLPRANGANGRIGSYESYVSEDGVTWEQVAAGTFPDDATLKTAEFRSPEQRAYVVTVTVPESSDASLSALAIDPGTLAPAFVSGTTEYAAIAPNGTTSAAVTAAANDAGATVAYASSAGTCEAPPTRGRASAAWNCAVAAPMTWITVTVTAANGDVQEYVIEVTVEELPGSLTTIDRVWPGSGVPEGGMPVQIFGSGFAAALTVTVGPYTDGLMIDVLFDPVNDGQIDFVMPAGVAGQRVSVTVATAGDAQTVPDAFTYVEPTVIQFNGLTGGVFTTTDGVVVEIPSQGVDGMFVITMTPLPPEPGVPGNILMYSFRLDALLNWVPLASLTNPVTIKLPVDEGIFALADGERPWLYQWTTDAKPTTDDGRPMSTVVCRPSSVVCRRLRVGFWTLVRGQEYDPGTRLMTVGLKPMGVYALSTAYLRAYWLPLVPVVK